MKRFVLLMLTVGLMVPGAKPSWAAEADKAADRYTVPEGDAADLAQFIGRLSQFKPGTVEEDIQHRSKSARAIRQAAERIVKLEEDRESEVRQVAEFVLLTGRIRAVAQAVPQERRKTVADVKAYVAEKVEAGRAQVAASVAKLLGQTLERASQWELAVEACRGLSEVLANSEDQAAAAQARAMEADARRLEALAESFRRVGPEIDIPPKGRLLPLDLEPKFNRNSNDFSGSGAFEGNGLAELPKGEQTLCGVLFKIGEGVVQLASTNAPGQPEKAEGIPVDRKIARLFVLHATQWGSPNSVEDGTAIGQYKVHYEDGSTASMPIVFGEDVRDWWNWDGGRPVTRGRVVWTGGNIATERNETGLRLYLGVWENPHPDKKVESVDFISTNDTICAPFCVAMTVEERAEP